MFGNLDLDFKLIDLKCLDFKSIGFRSHFKFKHFKGLKFLMDLDFPDIFFKLLKQRYLDLNNPNQIMSSKHTIENPSEPKGREKYTGYWWNAFCFPHPWGGQVGLASAAFSACTLIISLIRETNKAGKQKNLINCLTRN